MCQDSNLKKKKTHRCKKICNVLSKKLRYWLAWFLEVMSEANGFDMEIKQVCNMWI